MLCVKSIWSLVSRWNYAETWPLLKHVHKPYDDCLSSIYQVTPSETHSNLLAAQTQCTGSNYIEATFHLTPLKFTWIPSGLSCGNCSSRPWKSPRCIPMLPHLRAQCTNHNARWIDMKQRIFQAQVWTLIKCSAGSLSLTRLWGGRKNLRLKKDWSINHSLCYTSSQYASQCWTYW